MGYLSCLQQRDAALRRPYAASSCKPYPGKLPRRYYQLPHGAPAKWLLWTRLWNRMGTHSASVSLILMVAIVLSLYLYFLAAAQLAEPSQTVAAHGDASLLQPGDSGGAGAGELVSLHLHSTGKPGGSAKHDALKLSGSLAETSEVTAQSQSVDGVQVIIEELPAASAASTATGVKQGAHAASETDTSEAISTSWAATLANHAFRALGLAAAHRAAADTSDAAIFEMAAPIAQMSVVQGDVTDALVRDLAGAGEKQAGQDRASGEAAAAAVAATGQTPMVPDDVAIGAVVAAAESQAAHAAGDSRASVQELPPQATVAEPPPDGPSSQAAAAVDPVAQAAELSGSAAEASAVETPEPRLPPGLESELKAALAAAEAAAATSSAAAEQPQPGDVAAADKSGRPVEDIKEDGGDLEQDASPRRPGSVRASTKRRKRRDAVFFDDIEEDDDTHADSRQPWW